MKVGRLNIKAALALAGQVTQGALAATTGCTSSLSSSYPAPIVADGWSFRLVATGLTRPRGILFDRNGGLLVVQQGAGVIHLTLSDSGDTCVEVSKTTKLINSSELNHGIALSNDGKTLYASSSESVFSWTYNTDTTDVSVSETNKTIITKMSNSDHTTRTLLMSQKEPGILVVSRGSNSNIDPDARSLSSGHSQIKAFNTSNLISMSQPYDFNSEGRLLGWGLRNSVGVAEEPLTGGIYSVENSADEVKRNGVDIHQNNPGEEMNFHGFLNASTEHQGGNYGYPDCFTVWNTSIPDLGDLKVGSQFAIDPNNSLNDATCAKEYVPPQLAFQAHMAPLDIKFLPNGKEAYVTFHGSWDRTDPVGYKVATVAFSSGFPVLPSDSTSSAIDILTNADLSGCPDKCFRPVGLALDTKERLFMSSDATGEIYVLVKTGGGTGTGTPTSSGATPSTTKSSAVASRPDQSSCFAFGLVLIASLMLLV